MAVEFEVSEKVGVVTLAKPPHNLIDNELIEQMEVAYRTAVDQGCRAILLRSAMRHFCAGADVDAFRRGDRFNDQARLEALLTALEDVPIPTVAAVHGAALGGGVELALTCDMIVAADTSTFGMVEASIGLLPLLGGVQRVVQRAGLSRGKELAMLARRHDARTMERWGIVNLVTPESELQAVAMTWARQLAAGPTISLRSIKTLANTAARHGVAAADARQTEASNLMWQSDDQELGLSAFVSSGPGTGVFQGH